MSHPAAPRPGPSHPALGRAKRAFDLVLAALLLCILSPVMLLVALLVRVVLGRPVLFAQVRPGLDGRPFRLIKFRTMAEWRDSTGAPLADAERLGRLGRLLRSTSLDELPELVNVLRGDMSLVGPRPLLMEYLPLYSAEQARRHDVRPGLTGLAQVRGRNALDWDDKFALDVQYVDHWSLWLDIRILCLTLFTAVRREGVNQAGHATMPPFTGQSMGRSPGDE